MTKIEHRLKELNEEIGVELNLIRSVSVASRKSAALGKLDFFFDPRVILTWKGKTYTLNSNKRLLPQIEAIKTKQGDRSDEKDAGSDCRAVCCPHHGSS